jgi:hypothetical protein
MFQTIFYTKENGQLWVISTLKMLNDVLKLMCYVVAVSGLPLEVSTVADGCSAPGRRHPPGAPGRYPAQP